MGKASRKSKTDDGIRGWLPSPEQTPDESADTEARGRTALKESTAVEDSAGGEESTADADRLDHGDGRREGTVYSSRDAEHDRAGDGSKPVLVEPGRRFVAFLLEAVLFIGTFGIGWLVWSMIEWRDGRTPAKRLLRDLAVVDAWSGERVSWQRMALRELGAKIGLVGLFGMATFGLGWAISAALVLSDTRAALWDRLAGTTVVHPGG